MFRFISLKIQCFKVFLMADIVILVSRQKGGIVVDELCMIPDL